MVPYWKLHYAYRLRMITQLDLTSRQGQEWAAYVRTVCSIVLGETNCRRSLAEALPTNIKSILADQACLVTADLTSA